MGGGGGPRQFDKKSSDSVFFFFFSLVKFTAVKWLIQKKYHFQGSGGGPNFSRGGPTFSRGGGESNCLFPLETQITCDFPRGGGGGPQPLPPPLDPHLAARSI